KGGPCCLLMSAKGQTRPCGQLGSISGLTERGRLAAIARLSPRCNPGDYLDSRNGIYGISSAADAELLRLDVGCPDHLAPLFGFLGDEPAKVCGRDDKRRYSQVGKPRLDLGIGEAGIDLLVEFLDDLGGCVLGNADAIPVARLIARHELTHGRD